MNYRDEFGHFRIDTVLGFKTGNDSVLLTLLECKTRNAIVRKTYGYKFSEVFKTITGDNGF